jgi:biopolymer transport protein ExbD
MLLTADRLQATDFKRHLVARNHKKKTRKRALIIGLSLTSMVDMFSLLVIFLLQTFSTSPELLVVNRDVSLPSAMTGRELKDAPVLALAREQVYLDQKPVGTPESLLKNPEPLMKKLAELREQWQRSHPGQAFGGEINLQAHRDISSAIVSRFMAMLPSQHYGSIHLAVIAEGA